MTTTTKHHQTTPQQTIAAAFSHKSPFSAPLEKQDELERVKAALAAPKQANAAVTSLGGSTNAAAAAARAATLAAGQQSDQLLLVAAFEMWRLTGAAAGDKAAAQVARRHFLSTTALEAMLELRRQFAQLLQEAHLLPAPQQQQQQQDGASRSSSLSSPSPSHRREGGSGGGKWRSWADDPAQPCNRFAGRAEVLKAALVAALSPHVAVSLSSPGAGHAKPGWLDARGSQVCLHPSSVLAPLTASQLAHSHVVYLEKSKTTRVRCCGSGCVARACVVFEVCGGHFGRKAALVLWQRPTCHS